LPDLPASDLRRWLHPGVWERAQSAHASLLTEFRPCAALFFRFGGIDYDSPAAAMQLDAVVRLLQQVAARYDGLLVDLIVGEKGSYSYLNFGALTVHEDDARRALAAALSLAAAADKLDFLEPPQIGLAQAIMRVGSYGGPSRRHYGALGDGPALAARLMQAAAPGQILADESVWRAAIEQFQAVPQPPLTLKGIAQPVRAYAITGERPTRRAQLLQPDYPLPLVGRRAELMAISAKLALALAGRSQIVAVIGEAGIGKSRLLAEAIRLAQRRDFTGYGGACQSDGRDIPYHPWRTVWRGLLGLEESWPPGEQVARLTAVLQERLPHRLNGLPLLGRLLDLPIQENEFTIQLAPQYRQSALRALLEEFLQQAAQQTPLLIVLEDLHWLDPLSHDLLDALAGAVAAYPVCFLLAYRPPENARLQAPRLEKRENFTPLFLKELSWTEAAQLARVKLAQLYPDGGGALYAALVDELLTRAQGNPFFLEELLNYLRDQGIEPGDMGDGRRLELPDSLHTLILSRIDQLPARQKLIIRAASVIGRRFPVKWLTGYYPDLGESAQLQADLVQLDALDLTLLETAEPEPTYLFKHIITQEVAYESLPFAARAELHERLAAYLERTDTRPSLDLLAYHYAQSANQTKQREYFERAAAAAREAFANETALAYYAQLAPLLPEPTLAVELHLQWGAVLDLMGRYDEAEAHYQQALIVDDEAKGYAAQIQIALGKLYEQRGDYLAALASLEQAQQRWEALDNAVGLAQAYTLIGRVLWRQGIYVDAQRQVEIGLPSRRMPETRKPSLWRCICWALSL
jgi:adenylate cyclase